MKGKLHYSGGDKRFHIVSKDDETNGFHCGDGVTVFIDGNGLHGNFEMDSERKNGAEWYIALNGANLTAFEGLEAED